MTRPITDREWAKLRREATEVLPGQIADGLLPEVLLGYQARANMYLETVSRAVLVVEKSRRIGMTWGLAAYAVLRAARQRTAGGMDVMYISFSQEMTREFVDACGMWARAFALGASELGEFVFDDVDPTNPADTRKIQAFRIRFASGFELMALSSAPRSLRGKQGVVIVDEAAFVENLKELLKAALALLMWGGQVVVCSTHNGTDNDFNVLVQDVLAGRKPYRHMRVDLDDALQEGLFQRICLVTGEAWTPEGEAAWRSDIIAFYGEGADEELFCIAAQGSGAWLTSPLIEARMADIPVLRLARPPEFSLLPEPMRRAEIQAWIEAELKPVMENTLDDDLMSGFGMDIGRHRDGSVLWPLQMTRTLRRVTPFVVELFRIPFAQQEQIRNAIVDRLPRRLGGMTDAGGIGAQLGESGTDRYGPSMIGVKFSAEWYRVEMPPLKAAFEDDAIVVPRDAEILSDFRVIKIVRGVATVPDLRVTSATGGKRHGDAAIACALAYASTRMSVEAYGYEAAGRGGQDAFDRFWRGSEGLESLGGRRDGLW